MFPPSEPPLTRGHMLQLEGSSGTNYCSIRYEEERPWSLLFYPLSFQGRICTCTFWGSKPFRPCPHRLSYVCLNSGNTYRKILGRASRLIPASPKCLGQTFCFRLCVRHQFFRYRTCTKTSLLFLEWWIRQVEWILSGFHNFDRYKLDAWRNF